MEIQKIIITGGATRIGAAIAEGLANDKNQITIHYNKSKEMAEKLGVPLLGQIPLVQSIREAGDVGRPAALQNDTMVSLAFSEFAKKTAQHISILNSAQRNFVHPCTFWITNV